MKYIYITLTILASLSSSSLFSQTDSYTIWIGQKKILAHHETDAGDTVDLKRSMLGEKDTLIAEYHDFETPAHGSSTRLTLKDDMNHLLRGETNVQNQASHKASMPASMILKDWKLEDVKYLSITLVVHNDGESIAHGYKVGVLRLVD